MNWKHIATLFEKEQMRAWVENWKRVGPELEAIKRRELRAMTEEEGTRRALRLMEARLEPRWRAPERRAASGLIDQQSWFMKFRQGLP
ncbi:MAG: hypothetical protein ACR2NX_00205 [Chthoniobacterales bacterium]